MSGLLIRTCAKVNLCLRVLGKRPDGYHEVATVMHAISLWDCLVLWPAPEGERPRVRVRGQAPEDESNTALRAAELMAEAAGRGEGLGIELQKAIPAGAGLGGGSSDAAATLAGLARLWETEIPPPRLEAMAARIGADVPFFLRGGCCLARGRGEKLKTLPTVPLWLVLVVPGEPVATAEAYAALGRGSASSSPAVPQPVQRMTAALESGEPRAVAAALHNDFEQAELALPGLLAARRAKEALLSAGCLGACVSGSGSAAFGIARDLDEARAAAERLQEEWDWVKVVRTLSAGESMVISKLEGEAPREAGP